MAAASVPCDDKAIEVLVASWLLRCDGGGDGNAGPQSSQHHIL